MKQIDFFKEEKMVGLLTSLLPTLPLKNYETPDLATVWGI